MTLGDMRENCVRWLAASCWICHHQAVLSADIWQTTACGITRPNWKERPARESPTGAHRQ
jgi:hypothetical protein